MGRHPCCENMGLNKGPWTSEEDQILRAHIQQHGHQNWRALPKQAANPEFDATKESEPMNVPKFKSPVYAPVSAQESSSDFSSFTDFSAVTKENQIEYSSETFPENDQSFWGQAFPAENSAMASHDPVITDPQLQLPLSPISAMEPVYDYRTNMDDGMGFWYNLFIKAGDINQNFEDSFGRFSFPGEGFEF
ncbi:hypothetical protein HHK36_017156 [Tetracentron sinense]|uniref:Uncharacterized protein n=1 Tax=Tetracentron sinense TaxID=13715 RepID=A0A834Z295_TETSI|nr:hypothetical protein HHK36_017156 [Tetracentron sinense]